MDVREKLVGLINQGVKIYSDGYQRKLTAANTIAEHLIQNGVTVQKQGRWLLDGRCSECLENPLTTHKTYCPNCGAKMDLER